MSHLLGAVSSPILTKAFIAQLASKRFRRLFVEVRGWPVIAVAAPVPRVSILALAIGHNTPSLYPRPSSYHDYGRVWSRLCGGASGGIGTIGGAARTPQANPGQAWFVPCRDAPPLRDSLDGSCWYQRLVRCCLYSLLAMSKI